MKKITGSNITVEPLTVIQTIYSIINDTESAGNHNHSCEKD